MQNIIPTLLLAAVILGGTPVYSGQQDLLTVYADGVAQVFLDFPDSQQASLVKAAPAVADLKRCFKEMTGVPLPDIAKPGQIPLRLALLPPDVVGGSEPWGLQGYEISVRRDAITLSAPTVLGLVNAVMHLLDGWGCRWVMPDEIGEVIPVRTVLTLPLETRRHQVSSDSRVNFGRLQGPSEDEFNAWMRRNRMATERWMSGRHNYFHAIPPNQHFAEHPEYYALIGGKRRPTQLCTSNPDVIALMIEQAKTWFRNDAAVDSFPMDPEDNADFCQCESCVAGDPPGSYPDGQLLMTDRVIAFANAVARGIRDEYPDKRVALYAYLNHTLPPVKVRPEANLAIYLCRFNHCLLHLTPSSHCASPSDFMQLITAWKGLVPNLYLYEYYPIYWTGNLPCPNYLEFADSVRQTRQLGVLGSWEDNSFSFSNNTYINDYLAIRAKTNPNLTPQELLADLCMHFFGPSGDLMKTYYETLAEVTSYTHPGRNGMSGGLRNYDEMFSPAIVTRARAVLDDALALAAEGTPARQRVAMVERGQRYLEAYLEGVACAKRGQYVACVAAFDRAEELIDLLNPKCYGYSNAAACHQRIHQSRLRYLAEYFPEEMGMVRKWDLLGPLDNDTRDADLIEDQFEPGRQGIPELKLQTETDVAWALYESRGGLLDFKSAFTNRARSWHCSYAYAKITVNVQEDRAVQLRMDSFFPFLVYLNGKQVFHRAGCVADAPDGSIREVVLKAGMNTLLFKCSQTADDINFPWGLYLRITDQQGVPLRDLNFVDSL